MLSCSDLPAVAQEWPSLLPPCRGYTLCIWFCTCCPFVCSPEGLSYSWISKAGKKWMGRLFWEVALKYKTWQKTDQPALEALFAKVNYFTLFIFFLNPKICQCVLFQAFCLDLLTPLSYLSVGESRMCVWKVCLHTEGLCPETTEEALTKMKAGLGRSETSFGIDLCLLLWEEQVGRSSLVFFCFLFELSVCIFEFLSVLIEFLYDNLCNLSPQFLLFSFQLQWKLWCLISYFFFSVSCRHWDL